MAPANVPPHWLPYIAVDDVDASAAKVKDLGGTVRSAPMDIPEIGRFAVVADRQGATFAVFKGTKAAPQEPERPPIGTFCWAEVMSSDPESAAKFYAALFGYTVEEKDMGPMGVYRILKKGDRMRAGIMKKPEHIPVSHWLEYIAVKNVDDATRNAKELGATVHMQPTDIPKIGRFSVLGDPTGAAIALFTGTP
jgi:predicted enzyme related to lactoylglutathione lyase